jgi:hypothetical protein
MEEGSSQEGDIVRFRLADLPTRPEEISSTAVSPPTPSGQASLPEGSENLRASPSIAAALKPSTTTVAEVAEGDEELGDADLEGLGDD